MWPSQRTGPPMPVAQAEEIAANALAFTAADADRLGRFLADTGLQVDDLRRQAALPAVLSATLDFLLQDESLLLVFAATAAIEPGQIARARTALGGPSLDDGGS